MTLLPPPERKEIDHRTLKLFVGLIAITLPVLTAWFARSPLPSISAAFHEGGWSGTIFVGFLFAIGAFLAAYNGYSTREMVLSKIASAAALGVALFPCQCGNHSELVPNAHAVSAAALFLILAFFCREFGRRAWEKQHPQARLRAGIYAVCGALIVMCMALVGLDVVLSGALSARVPRLTFYVETVALLAFGLSWLTASRVLPVLTRPEERFSPLRDSPAD